MQPIEKLGRVMVGQADGIDIAPMIHPRIGRQAKSVSNEVSKVIEVG